LTGTLRAAKILAMHLKLKLRLRATFAALAGALLLCESVDSELLLHGFQAWATMVNLFIAMFGAAFLVQSWLIIRRLQAARSK
jgi:hypothetical protein